MPMSVRVRGAGRIAGEGEVAGSHVEIAGESGPAMCLVSRQTGADSCREDGDSGLGCFPHTPVCHSPECLHACCDLVESLGRLFTLSCECVRGWQGGGGCGEGFIGNLMDLGLGAALTIGMAVGRPCQSGWAEYFGLWSVMPFLIQAVGRFRGSLERSGCEWMFRRT
jgi:hypothetical protein